MKAGAVLVVAGAWVLCQIFGGQALQRLNIIAGAAPSSTPGSSGSGSSTGGSSSGGTGGVIGSGTV